MSEPLYHSILGLYLTLDDFRKAVKPGQTAYLWMPPDFERVQGVIGEGWGAGMDKPMILFKYSEGIIPVTDENVWFFQPGSRKK